MLFPYYVVPPLVLLLVAAFHRGVWRPIAAVAVGVGLVVLSRPRLEDWAFWGLMVLGFLLLAAIGFPGRITADHEPERVHEREDKSLSAVR